MQISGASWFLGLYALTLSLPAWGYIDPGTSGVILQILIGGAIGALFYVKKASQLFMGFFRRDKSNV